MVAYNLADGILCRCGFVSGRWRRVEGDDILLGTPFTFTKDSVDRVDP